MCKPNDFGAQLNCWKGKWGMKHLARQYSEPLKGSYTSRVWVWARGMEHLYHGWSPAGGCEANILTCCPTALRCASFSAIATTTSPSSPFPVAACLLPTHLPELNRLPSSFLMWSFKLMTPWINGKELQEGQIHKPALEQYLMSFI